MASSGINSTPMAQGGVPIWENVASFCNSNIVSTFYFWTEKSDFFYEVTKQHDSIESIRLTMPGLAHSFDFARAT